MLKTPTASVAPSPEPIPKRVHHTVTAEHISEACVNIFGNNFHQEETTTTIAASSHRHLESWHAIACGTLGCFLIFCVLLVMIYVISKASQVQKEHIH